MSSSNFPLNTLTPYAWAFWLNGAAPEPQRAMLSRPEPSAYSVRVPLYTGEEVLRAIDEHQKTLAAEPSASQAATRFVGDFFASRGFYPSILQAFEAGSAHGARQPSIDELCARIKAADDAAADGDYMLDSDDCIKVLRGQWTGPMAVDGPPAPEPAAPGLPDEQWDTELADRLEFEIRALQEAQDRVLEGPAQRLMARIAACEVLEREQETQFRREISRFPAGFHRTELTTALNVQIARWSQFP